jgi:hypothetical protein
LSAWVNSHARWDFPPESQRSAGISKHLPARFGQTAGLCRSGLSQACISGGGAPVSVGEAGRSPAHPVRSRAGNSNKRKHFISFWSPVA